MSNPIKERKTALKIAKAQHALKEAREFMANVDHNAPIQELGTGHLFTMKNGSTQLHPDFRTK